MTGKQRILAALDGRRTDRIPIHHIQFSGDAAAKILGREAFVGGAYLQWQQINALWNGPDAHAEFLERRERDALAIAEACEHDLLRLHYWGWPAREVPTRRIDDRTFGFGDEATGYTLEYRPDVELLVRGDLRPVRQKPDPMSLTEYWIDGRLDEERRATAVGESALPLLLEDYARCIAAHPDYVLKLGTLTVFVDMQEACEMAAVGLWPEKFAELLMLRARRIAADLPALADAGLPANFAGMDICTQTGPTLSPAVFRDVVLPALKHIVDACHACGMKYVYGSDGNFWSLADMMFDDIGVDGWFEVDKLAGMDLRGLRARYPGVTLIGNIPVRVLHTGSRDEVIRETMGCLAVAHELGGVIVGCSNMIMPGTPAENIHAMLDCIRGNR